MRVKRCVVILLALMILSTSTAFANEPYNSYNYDYWGSAIPAPAAYIPSKLVDGNTLGISDFKSPMDLFVSSDNKVYIADSGNNRIVVIDEHWELDTVISEFNNNGKTDTFNNPQGLFVTSDGDIYVADTDNARIIHLDTDGTFLREIGAPVADIIQGDFNYRPTSLVVDKAKRIYVVALGVNRGIIELDSEGSFRGYMGANRVTPNMLDYFWKLISTDAQRDRMELFVPTEYNNISIDDEGFIYVTTSTLSLDDILNAINSRSAADDRGAPIRKLNPTGDDILRRYGFFPPVGDIQFFSRGYAESGQSQLTDVCIEEYGIYSVLDKKKGRIFTYDSDSNLLYVFGGTGNRLGTFRNPTAFDNINGNYAVLDSILGQITVFELTEYGRLLKEAVTLHQQGKYSDSATRWEEVLHYNVNADLAYIGMGKAYLRKDEYSSAMKYFKLGSKREYYTKAFQLYRKEVISNNFGLIMTVVLAAVIGMLLYSWRKGRNEVEL